MVAALVLSVAAPSVALCAKTSTGSTLVLVPWETSPLVANFTYRVNGATCPPDGEVTNSVTLNGSASGGLPPYTYSWALPTGSAVGPEVNTTTTYGDNNSVTLTVADSSDLTATHTEVLPVEVPPCAPPFDAAGSVQVLEIALGILVAAGSFGIGVVLWRRGRRRKSPGLAPGDENRAS